MWHNAQLHKTTGNYPLFIVLTVFLFACLSWFYYSAFKNYKKELELLSVEVKTEAETSTSEIANEIAVQLQTFDKESFVSAIVPSDETHEGILMLNRKDINQYCESILQNLARNLNIVQGVFYIKKRNEENFEAAAHYAYYSDETPPSFRVGETLPGQAVKDNRIVAIQNIPENYISVVSGLGNSKPRNLIMVPVYANKEPVGLIEFAVFTSLDTDIESALKEISVIIGKNILKLMY